MNILIYIVEIVLVLFAIIAHEMAHAYMSYFLGDPTPKETGRLTPNPLKHIDIYGLIFMILFRIGWAKPVMINSEYYKNRKFGIFLVALAGPLMNIILSVISLVGCAVIIRFVNNIKIVDVSVELLSYFSIINLSLALFNLIPIPPLDGSRILGSFLSANAYIGYMKIERYGFMIVFAILGLDRLVSYFTGNPTLFSTALEYIYNFLVDVVLSIFSLI